jgi:hypothetical protein
LTSFAHIPPPLPHILRRWERSRRENRVKCRASSFMCLHMPHPIRRRVEPLDVNGAASDHEENLGGVARDVLIITAYTAERVAVHLCMRHQIQPAFAADRGDGGFNGLCFV